LKFLKEFKLLCCFIQNLSNLIAADALNRILSSYWLAVFYLKKKSTNGLGDQLSAPVWETPNRPPNITCLVPAFLEPDLAEKMAVCGHTTRLPKK
jgi:hypothetical protein